MPIYEYRCESCSQEFETFIKRRDEDPESCPECGGEEMKRLISDTSFQLKGSGWYETDYARDDDPDAEGADDSAGEDSAEESADEPSGGGESEAADGETASAAAAAQPT